MIKFMKLHPNARIPKIQCKGDAGFDIYANSAGIVCMGYVSKFNTGIAAEIPDGYVGIIEPRSGLAAKHGVGVLAGVIDSSYRGEIQVMLTSHDRDETIELKAGDRIAQLVVKKIETESIEVDSLDDTDRGINGFGSTGL